MEQEKNLTITDVAVSPLFIYPSTHIIYGPIKKCFRKKLDEYNDKDDRDDQIFKNYVDFFVSHYQQFANRIYSLQHIKDQFGHFNDNFQKRCQQELSRSYNGFRYMGSYEQRMDAAYLAMTTN